MLPPLELNLKALQSQEQTTMAAMLDCTGSWFKEEDWTGIPVSDLLTAAQANPNARYVSFRSVTGLPLEPFPGRATGG